LGEDSVIHYEIEIDMAKSRIIMGIDPGLSGAVAFLAPSEQRVAVFDTPVMDGRVNGTELATLIRQWAPDVAIIELSSSRPGQGLSSTFKYGVSFGCACGVVNALEIPIHYVSPSKWKKQLRLSSDKEESRRRAIETWPSCAEHFKRKLDHNKAEACLLALYGASISQGDDHAR
jgi:crossover junction endodeoxyribonuclease RuvC